MHRKHRHTLGSCIPLGFVAAIFLLASSACGDSVVHDYSGDLFPEDAGWPYFQPCEAPCTRSIEDGYLVLQWVGGVDFVNYHRDINDPDLLPPPISLWIEWRFRSNSTLTNDPGCDASVHAQYYHVQDLIYIFGDAAVSFDWSVVEWFPWNEFRTYRFETRDGVEYRFLVNGNVFLQRSGDVVSMRDFVQMRGNGGCGTVSGEVRINEWDYLRYGEITPGELIVEADPPAGIVSAAEHPDLDRFTVRFDAPNYVLVDEISVEVTSGTQAQSHQGTKGNTFAILDSAFDIPSVVATRRLDNGPPDVVEIVLDKPLPLGATTTFTFDDGTAVNVVSYTYLLLGACCLPDDSSPLAKDGFQSSPLAKGGLRGVAVGGLCVDTDEADCAASGGAFTAGGACAGDADQDSVDASCGDGCPDDPFKLSPGQCGCGFADTDSDLDTVADCVDQCPEEDDTVDKDGDKIPDCLQFQGIPAVTAWGILALSLLLLIAAKVRSAISGTSSSVQGRSD